jgi:hypothetical protein
MVGRRRIATSGIRRLRGTMPVLAAHRVLVDAAGELWHPARGPPTAWRSCSTVSCNWTHRHWSLRVRIHRSAQPPVSGSPSNAGLSVMPSHASEPVKWAERYCGPSRDAVAGRGRCLGRAGPTGQRRRRRPAAGRRSGHPPWPRASTPGRWSGRCRQPPTPTRRPGSRPWSHPCRERWLGAWGMIAAVVGPGFAAAPDPLRRQQALLAQRAEHAFAADLDGVVATQPRTVLGAEPGLAP